MESKGPGNSSFETKIVPLASKFVPECKIVFELSPVLCKNTEYERYCDGIFKRSFSLIVIEKCPTLLGVDV